MVSLRDMNTLGSGIGGIIEEFSGKGETRAVKHTYAYRERDEKKGDVVDMRTWAKRRGLEDKIPEYVRDHRSSMTGYLGMAHKLVMDAIDVGEDLFEGADVISQVARKGTLVLELPWRTLEIPTYVATYTVKAALDLALGVPSGNYAFDKPGVKRYFADRVWSGIGTAINQVDVIGSAVEWTTHFDDRTKHLDDATARAVFSRLQKDEEKSLEQQLREAPRMDCGKPGCVVEYNAFVPQGPGSNYTNDRATRGIPYEQLPMAA